MNEDAAAIVIQRRFRRRLQENRTKTATSPLVVRTDRSCDKLRDDEKLRAKRVLEEVNLFYRKLTANLKKKEEIRKLCADIDEISSDLKAIRRLEQCKVLETSFGGTEIMEKIKERHDEQMRRCNLRWWEKLDMYENV